MADQRHQFHGGDLLTGLVETVCFVLLLFLPCGISPATATRCPCRSVNPSNPRRSLPHSRNGPAARWAHCSALTAATAALSFAYLGSRTAPQNPLDATDTVLTETVTPQGDAVSLWVYPGISFGGSMTVTDAAGNVVLKKN